MTPPLHIHIAPGGAATVTNGEVDALMERVQKLVQRSRANSDLHGNFLMGLGAE